MNRQIYNSGSIEETRKVAQALSSECAKGRVIALYGNLGAGKTLFSQALISKLCGFNDGESKVTSPTFNLLQNYQGVNGMPIYHFDLYRLNDPEEIIDIGYEDCLKNGFSIIEWPQIIEDMLPPVEDTIFVKITKDESRGENARLIEIVKSQ